jgi:hypothetical protein
MSKKRLFEASDDLLLARAEDLCPSHRFLSRRFISSYLLLLQVASLKNRLRVLLRYDVRWSSPWACLFCRITFIPMLAFPCILLYEYRIHQVIPYLPFFGFSLYLLVLIDLGSRISRSFDSFRESSSSIGSIVPLSGPADSDEVTSPTLQDIWAELSGLKLVLVSHKHTLVERSNQLSRLMGKLDSKDHQLALTNQQIQL